MENSGRRYFRVSGINRASRGKHTSYYCLHTSIFIIFHSQGNYIESETINYGDNLTLKYFPASDLPVDPAARFSDLFLTRKKWKGEDISPFLSDIAVNSKERDKLLLKYCRTVTESGGVRYTARAQYNG
jgi:sister chromatid cohesion protein DCC1